MPDSQDPGPEDTGPKDTGPEDTVRRFFDALGTGNFAAIGDFFTDDSVWMVNDVARGLPRQQGRKAITDDFLQPIR
ncbi:MAG TPA: nuclear transport factor 2 family protein, partial [Trebonia sp.]